MSQPLPIARCSIVAGIQRQQKVSKTEARRQMEQARTDVKNGKNPSTVLTKLGLDPQYYWPDLLTFH